MEPTANLNVGKLSPPAFFDAQVLTALDDFSSAIHQNVAQNQSGNFAVSPLSLTVTSLLLLFGSKGNTRKELQTSLRLPSSLATGQNDAKLVVSLMLTNDDLGFGKTSDLNDYFEFTSVNKMFLDTDFSVRPTYKTIIGKKLFSAGVENVPLKSDPEGQRQKINKWVADQTHDKIKDLLPPQSIKSDTKAVLTNAMYFKAKWDQPFQLQMTKKADFTNIDGKKAKVDMMGTNLNRFVNYAEDDDLQYMELPYRNKNFTALFILPKKVDGIKAVESKLTSAYFRTLKTIAKNEKTNVRIPRFRVELSLDGIPLFKQLGVNDLFVPNQADLSGIAPGLYVSVIQHKAFIDVNEEGTEAAAATAAVMGMGASPQKPKDFIADHPFVFAIRNEKTGLRIFTARVATL